MKTRSVARWLVTLTALTIAIAWLARLGDGALSAPPLSVSDVPSWLDQRDTAAVTFSLLRLVALGFGAYLLVVLLLGGAARALHLTRVATLTDRVTLPFARTLFGGVALLGVMGAPPALQPQARDTMVELSPDTTVGDGQATLHLLPDEPTPEPTPEPAPTSTPVPPSTDAPTPAPDSASVPQSDDGDSWVVQHGESFWSIAQQHLDDVRGERVDLRDVDAYWRRLVELNRSRLIDENEPDLLFTGQVIELPAVAVG